MHRHSPPPVGLLLLAFAAASCAAARPTTALTADEHVLTLEDHESHIQLAVGDVLTLKLDATPSTGYAWTVVRNDVALLTPLGEPRFERGGPPATGPLGASGRQVFRFRAKAAGSEKLELHYRRSWEKQPPLKTFAVETHIR